MESVSSSFLFKNLEREIVMDTFTLIMALIVIALSYWWRMRVNKLLEDLSVLVIYLMEKERKNNDDDE